MDRDEGMKKIEKIKRAPRKPANCWDIMNPEIVGYVEGERLTCVYPVLEMYTNPRKSMQGGFISAAFDNTAGALLFAETGSQAMASIDLNVNYQRPIFENDRLRCTAYLKSMGKTLAHIYAEAFDGQDRLIATATTNIMLLNDENFARKQQD